MSDTTQIDWNSFTPVDLAVLCFIQQGDSVLLIEKKRGLGAGKVNGPGGKLDPGETFYDAAVRETEEEVGLTPLDPQWRATLDFAFTDGYSLTVRVFVSKGYTGTLIETDEALPFWNAVGEIPLHRMWEDDSIWLPTVLSGGEIAGRFLFDGDRMVTSELRYGVRVLSTDSGSPE